MSKPTYFVWSICFSPPRDGTDVNERFRRKKCMEWIKSHCDYWVIGEEKGEGNENEPVPNHLDICLKTKIAKYQSNMKRDWDKWCEYDRDDKNQKEHALVIAGHSDFDYKAGYSMKEGKYKTNLSEEHIKKCKDKYASGKADYDKGNDSRTRTNKDSKWTVNRIGDELRNFCIRLNYSFLTPDIYKDFLSQNADKYTLQTRHRLRYEIVAEFVEEYVIFVRRYKGKEIVDKTTETKDCENCNNGYSCGKPYCKSLNIIDDSDTLIEKIDKAIDEKIKPKKKADRNHFLEKNEVKSK